MGVPAPDEYLREHEPGLDQPRLAVALVAKTGLRPRALPRRAEADRTADLEPVLDEQELRPAAQRCPTSAYQPSSPPAIKTPKKRLPLPANNAHRGRDTQENSV